MESSDNDYMSDETPLTSHIPKPPRNLFTSANMSKDTNAQEG